MMSLPASCFPICKQGARLLNKRLVPPLRPLILSSDNGIPKPPQMQQQQANFASSSFFSGQNWSLNPMSMMSLDSQEGQFTKQMEEMAKMKKWDIRAHHDALDTVTKSMKTKIAAKFTGGGDELDQAKKSQKIAQSIITHVGSDAVSKDLENLTKIQELRIANDAEVTVASLNEEIQKFSMTTTMHRLLRFCLKKRVKLPKSAEEMRTVMEYYGPEMLSKKERKQMERQVMEKQKQQGRYN